jgi:hypothetical protein
LCALPDVRDLKDVSFSLIVVDETFPFWEYFAGYFQCTFIAVPLSGFS